MSDPTPGLTALCDVLNEVADTPAGTNLLPYAERIKAIVIEALAQEAESDDLHLDDPVVYDTDDGSQMVSTYLADWLEAHLPEDQP